MSKLPDKYVLNRCSQCGEVFTKENMIEYETVWVCAHCKPVFMKKIKEGIEIEPKASNMTGWKILFFIFLAWALFCFTFSIRQILKAEIRLEDILNLIVGPFITVALFGFSFEKKILYRIIWKVLFPIMMFLESIEIVLLFFHHPSFENRFFLIVEFIVISPLLIFKYIAFYKYAFSKRKPWI